MTEPDVGQVVWAYGRWWAHEIPGWYPVGVDDTAWTWADLTEAADLSIALPLTRPEASVTSIGLVGVIHDEANRAAWRETASDVGVRLERLRRQREW